MTKRTIALHIGPHKTGSTAIQTFCNENRSLLDSGGVHYASGFWHGQLGSCFAEDPLRFVFNVHGNRTNRDQIAAEDANYLASLQREIESTSHPTVVLSYEGFFSLQTAEIARLHDYLKGISDRQIVVFYCRPPVSFAVSELSQRLRMGLPAGFDDGSILPILDYQEKIPPFVDIFGRANVVARHFDRSQLTNADVVDDFFAAIDHPQINRHSAPGLCGSENESISAEAALLAAEIAKRSGPPMPGNRFFLRYDRILSRIRGTKITLNEDQLARVLAASTSHSEYLQKEFGIQFEEDSGPAQTEQRLFQEDFLESMAVQLQDLVTQMEREAALQAAREQRLIAKADALEKELHGVYASNSWRITAPLRSLRRSLSGKLESLAPWARPTLPRLNRTASGN